MTNEARMQMAKALVEKRFREMLGLPPADERSQPGATGGVEPAAGRAGHQAEGPSGSANASPSSSSGAGRPGQPRDDPSGGERSQWHLDKSQENKDLREAGGEDDGRTNPIAGEHG
jgi:hypothetical protein